MKAVIRWALVDEDDMNNSSQYFTTKEEAIKIRDGAVAIAKDPSVKVSLAKQRPVKVQITEVKA